MDLVEAIEGRHALQSHVAGALVDRGCHQGGV